MGDVELGVRAWLTPAERVEVRDEMAAHPVHVDQRVDLHDLLELRRRIGERAAVGVPARRFVRHRQAREHVVVEPVVPEEQIVDPAEELAALRAGDDAVVVGVGEGGDLADTDLRQRGGIGALVLGGVADGADADDEALARHQPRHRMDGADHAGIRDRAGGAGEVVGGHRAAADLLDELLVGGPEAGEVEGVGLLHARDEERVRSVASLDVDGEPEVHVLVVDDDRLAVDLGVGRVETGKVAERTEHAEGDEVREAHLARAGAGELIVQDLAVDLEQLGRHRAHGGRGGDAEARFHVLDGAGRGAAQRLGIVAVEERGPGRRRGGRRRRDGCRGSGSRRSRSRRGTVTVGGRVAVGEVGAPVLVDRRGVLDVALVDLLHQTGVRPEVFETRHVPIVAWGARIAQMSRYRRRSSAVWNARSSD